MFSNIVFRLQSYSIFPSACLCPSVCLSLTISMHICFINPPLLPSELFFLSHSPHPNASQFQEIKVSSQLCFIYMGRLQYMCLVWIKFLLLLAPMLVLVFLINYNIWKCMYRIEKFYAYFLYKNAIEESSSLTVQRIISKHS